jgi:hypothetical protein
MDAAIVITDSNPSIASTLTPRFPAEKASGMMRSFVREPLKSDNLADPRGADEAE